MGEGNETTPDPTGRHKFSSERYDWVDDIIQNRSQVGIDPVCKITMEIMLLKIFIPAS